MDSVAAVELRDKQIRIGRLAHHLVEIDHGVETVPSCGSIDSPHCGSPSLHHSSRYWCPKAARYERLDRDVFSHSGVSHVVLFSRLPGHSGRGWPHHSHSADRKSVV